MNDIPVGDTRNFALMGHTGAGKTTLVDALLFKLGVTDRMGLVSAGSSAADYTDEEKARGNTIFSKPFSAKYKDGGKVRDLVFIDTPGYADFFGQVIAASHAVDAALIAVDAAAGVQVGTRRTWKCCTNHGLARGIVVTGLDRDNTDFAKTVAGIQEAFGAHCLPVVLPTSDGKGVIDIFGAKPIPPAMAEAADEARLAVTERAAETDDQLIEKFLGGETLAPAEVASGMRKAVLQGGLVPIFVCLPLKDVGLPELLEGIVRLFPSPLEREVKDAEGKPVATAADAPFAGMVWRTVNEAFGQMTFVRVFGGTLHNEGEVFNSTKGQKERIGGLVIVNGKKTENVTSAAAGDIVSLPKLKVTGINDSLCAANHKVVFTPIKFPNPVMFQSVQAKTQADEDKLGQALQRVAEEDPTLSITRNTETHEMIIGGLGDKHIDVAVDRMKSRSNVEVILTTPKVPYRETVTTTGEGHYKHKKQSGGRGQYGEVFLRVKPKPASDPEWFEDAVVGGVIPHNFMPAVQKGLLEGMVHGVLAAFPVCDVKISVYDGSYHDVDSSEISFKIAGGRALKDGMSKAKPVLLEPIMKVRIMVPDHYMGTVNGDLNNRRGRILGMEVQEGMQVIVADVPQAELFRYAAELRSMTAGQGGFEMEFSRYEVVPSMIAQKIIAAAEKQKEEQE